MRVKGPGKSVLGVHMSGDPDERPGSVEDSQLEPGDPRGIIARGKLEGVPKGSKVAEETVVGPSRVDDGTPKVARYMDEAGDVGRVNVAQGNKVDRFTPDLMGENLRIGGRRGRWSDGG